MTIMFPFYTSGHWTPLSHEKEHVIIFVIPDSPTWRGWARMRKSGNEMGWRRL